MGKSTISVGFIFGGAYLVLNLLFLNLIGRLFGFGWIVNLGFEYLVFPVMLLFAIKVVYSDPGNKGARHAFALMLLMVLVKHLGWFIYVTIKNGFNIGTTVRFLYDPYVLMRNLEFIAIGTLFITIAGTWRMFVKAGRQGWESLIPIYNSVVQCKIAGVSGWWILLFMIPLVGIYFAVVMLNKLAKSFGKEAGFTVGLVFLPFIFFPKLGFGDAVYKGWTRYSEKPEPY